MRVLSTKSPPGKDIAQLQQFLIGQDLYHGIADGEFGPKTEAAIIEFQKLHRLKPDGFVGPQTLAALIADGLPVVTDSDRDIPLEPPGLNPLTNNEERQRHWGRIQYVAAPTAANPEGIRITNDFEEEHIIRVDCPAWKRKLPFHQRVAEHYVQFMDAIIEAGLRDRLLTFEGSFVPRFIRGSRSVLSNHSWGTAFDINYQWNRLGKMPAFIGDPGCVRELVDIGVTFGWYWGGWFKRRDGMHFEHL
jgi:hypothetical protein